MSDMRPAKGRKRYWAVKAIWVKDACHECVDLVCDKCQNEGITLPELPSNLPYEFYAPYPFLTLVCAHENSPHKGKPVIESIYGKKS